MISFRNEFTFYFRETRCVSGIQHSGLSAESQLQPPASTGINRQTPERKIDKAKLKDLTKSPLNTQGIFFLNKFKCVTRIIYLSKTQFEH